MRPLHISNMEFKYREGFKYIERNGLHYFPLNDLTREDWLRLRGMGGAIGGSDVGTICGWNYRQSPTGLFYQKIGIAFNDDSGHNEYTYWGSTNERNLMVTAQYYDHDDPASYIDNREMGIQFREIEDFKYSIRNPEIPMFNVNVDGMIDINPDTWVARRIAEAKTISRQSAEMWQTIPPYHLGQILVYMCALKPMLTEDVAEIYYLQDGNKFYGYEIPQSPIVLERILEKCFIFYAKVQKGLEIVAGEPNPTLMYQALCEIEPDPDDTEAYQDFLSDLFKKKQKLVKVVGSDDDLRLAREYRAVDKELKDLTKLRQELKNKIWKVLHKNNANVVDFGADGKITYNKRLYVNIK